MSNIFDLIDDIEEEAESFNDDGKARIAKVREMVSKGACSTDEEGRTICPVVAKCETRFNDAEAKLRDLNALVDEEFDTWHRITFGSQASVDPDIKLAYQEGLRRGIERGK